MQGSQIALLSDTRHLMHEIHSHIINFILHEIEDCQCFYSDIHMIEEHHNTYVNNCLLQLREFKP